MPPRKSGKNIPSIRRASWALPLALQLFLVAKPTSLPGQDAPPISVNVDLVVLHATVRDRKSGFLQDLPQGAFHVYEDGRPQTIRLFKYEDTPVSVGLIIDNSSSMARKRNDVILAALKFVRSSNPQDEVFVVNFNERPSFGLPPGQLFSTDYSELVPALNGVPARGMTALYDAIDDGLRHLQKATREKKVLIVVSDGGDNASHHQLSQVLQDAEKSNVIIYTIGLFDEDDEDRNPGVLRKIAHETGGEVFLPDETIKVGQVCQQIASDIRHQYTIGYISSNQKQDGSYRTIKVTVSGPHTGGAFVRTRAGYIAPGSPRKGQ